MLLNSKSYPLYGLIEEDVIIISFFSTPYLVAESRLVAIPKPSNQLYLNMYDPCYQVEQLGCSKSFILGFFM